MTSNIVKLLFLMVLSVFAVSCGEKSKPGADSEKETSSTLMKKEKSGLDESIFKVIADKDGVSDTAKNAIMIQVKTAIDTHKAIKADRDAAISKAVADNGALQGFDMEIKAAVDAKHPIQAPPVELEKAENLGAATYKIFKDIFDAHRDLAAPLNDLLALVKVINAEETVANASTQATRNAKIDVLKIPAGGLGGKTVAQWKAELKIAMESDVHLPAGVVTLILPTDSGIDLNIYNKITERPLRGARTDAQLNAIITAVRDAIGNPPTEPSPARDQRIIDAVAAQGGADVPYSTAIKNVVDTAHAFVLILESASRLLHDTYVAVVNTAHANLHHGHRNILIARVAAAKALGTTVLRNDAIDRAITEVRGLALGAALAGEDLALATAIKRAVATDYAIAITALADSGLDNAVWSLIHGCARDPEQKNNIMVAVRNVIAEPVEAVRNAAILAAVTAQSAGGATDIATLSGVIQTAVTNTYFPAGMPSFAQSHLDYQIYAAIRDFPGLTAAHRTALIGALHPAAATEVRAAMDARPRVKATRDAALGAAAGRLGLGVADASNLTVALIGAAELAQPADGENILTAQAVSGLPVRVYDALVGNGVPLAITNAQMNAAMLPMLNALNERPCVQATRNTAIENVVRGALAMDPAAVLAAGSDARVWADALKAAADLAQPATALTAKPALMDQGVYDAITGNTAAGVNVHKDISNLQMNTIIRKVNKHVLMVRPQDDKATRDGIVDGYAANGTAVKVAGGLNQNVPATADWNTQIKAALDVAIPDVAAKPANLDQDVYDDVTVRLASNKAKNDLNVALEAAIAIDNQAGRLAALNPAFDSFLATVLDRTGGAVIVDADKTAAKEEILRLFNSLHALAVAANFAGTIKPIPAGGFDVTITVTGDTAVAKVGDHVFLPANMTGGLPLDDGDIVHFNDLSANKDANLPRNGLVALVRGANKVRTVTALVVNFSTP